MGYGSDVKKLPVFLDSTRRSRTEISVSGFGVRSFNMPRRNVLDEPSDYG